MSDLIVVDEFYSWLLDDLRIGQEPRARPSRAIPSLWLKPDDGAIPAPRVDGEIVVTVTDPIVGIPSPNEPWIEETFVEVTTRSRNANAARLIHRVIRSRIAPAHVLGGARQWRMGAIDPIEYSTLWRGEQDLPSIDGQTHLRRSSYRLAARTKVLAGLPYP